MQSLTRPIRSSCSAILPTRGVLTTAGCALALGLCGLLGSRADAATAAQPLTVSATIGEALSLIIGTPTASAAAGDPSASISAADTLTLSIPAANEVTIPVTVQVRTSAQARVILTVEAADDPRGGTEIIPCQEVTWSASGAGFQGGTLSKTEAQTVGSWTGSGMRSGAIRYAVANSSGHAPGTYTTALTYTLATP